MKERSYRVILDGAVIDGFDRDQVIEKLSGVFKKDGRVIEKLLAAAPRPIKGGLDLATARKYTALLGKLGAASHVEEESREPGAATPEKRSVARPERPPNPARESEPHVVPRQERRPTPPVERKDPTRTRAAAESKTPSGEAIVCPKCGYTPSSSEDVIVVRGDCPRCGLRVRKDLVIEESESEEAAYERLKARPELIYRDRIPASWERRGAAGLYTFGLFLAVHASLVLLWIVLFVPVDNIPIHAGTLFLQAAILDWPGLLLSGAIVLVSFILPIFNRGLSWGQRMADIELLYTEETQIGGYYVSLGLRAMVAIAVSLGPGWVSLWIGSCFRWYPEVWTQAAVMLVGGIAGWLTSWVYVYMRSDSRSLADLAAGTVQVEEAPMPRGVYGKAWILILAAVGCWLLLAGVIPLVLKLIRSW